MTESYHTQQSFRPKFYLLLIKTAPHLDLCCCLFNLPLGFFLFLFFIKCNIASDFGLFSKSWCTVALRPAVSPRPAVTVGALQECRIRMTQGVLPPVYLSFLQARCVEMPQGVQVVILIIRIVYTATQMPGKGIRVRHDHRVSKIGCLYLNTAIPAQSFQSLFFYGFLSNSQIQFSHAEIHSVRLSKSRPVRIMSAFLCRSLALHDLWGVVCCPIVLI